MASIDELLGLVTRVRVESAYLPTIELDDPFRPGPPNPVLRALKPKVTLEIARGAGKSIVVAPYGEPGPTRWPIIQGALLVGAAALIGIGLGALARRLS